MRRSNKSFEKSTALIKLLCLFVCFVCVFMCQVAKTDKVFRTPHHTAVTINKVSSKFPDFANLLPTRTNVRIFRGSHRLTRIHYLVRGSTIWRVDPLSELFCISSLCKHSTPSVLWGRKMQNISLVIATVWNYSHWPINMVIDISVVYWRQVQECSLAIDAMLWEWYPTPWIHKGTLFHVAD